RELLHRVAGVGEAIGAREAPVEAVEAAILLVDHDDVVDLLQAARGRGHRRQASRDHRDQGQDAQGPEHGGQTSQGHPASPPSLAAGPNRPALLISESTSARVCYRPWINAK